MYVVRDTYHPLEDMNRNWSAPVGGWDNSLGGMSFETAEEAAESDEKECGQRREYRYHPAYEGFVLVHYEGLGAYALNAETLEEAIREAAEMPDGLAITSEKGDGHFFAQDVISFHQVREGRYVFEIK